MESREADTLPRGDEWQYEPKWDGFRCIAFRDGDKVLLQSKSGQPLERYFPEVVERLLTIKAKRFVLDGELVVPVGRACPLTICCSAFIPLEAGYCGLRKSAPPGLSSSICWLRAIACG